MAQTPLQPNYTKVFIQRDFSEGMKCCYNRDFVQNFNLKNNMLEKLIKLTFLFP
jgi:hypothetical protein